MKKIITLMIASIFVVLVANFVFAMGVTYPHPQNIELKPGQSSYFTFQIQSDDFPLVCVPIIEDAAGLEFAFNTQYNVGANQKFSVKPQIIVPKQTPFGDYKASFCIECEPSREVEGSKIIPRICNLPVTVSVVTERTRKNIFEEELGYIWLWITLLIIAIIILAIVIFYLVRRRARAAKP